MIGGLSLAVTRPQTITYLKTNLEQVATEQLNLPVSLNALDISVLPPAITAHGVTISKIGHQTPWLSVNRVKLRPRPWPATDGTFVLSSITIDGLRGTAQLDELKQMAKNLPSSESDGPNVRIRELALHNLTTTLLWGDGNSLSLQNAEGLLQDSWRDRKDLSFSVSDAALVYQEQALTFDLNTAARLVDISVNHGELRIDKLDLHLPQTDLSITGTAPLDLSKSLNLKVSGTTELAEISQRILSNDFLAGKTQFDGQLTGSVLTPTVSATTSVIDLHIGQQHVGNVKTAATIDKERIVVRNYSVTHPAMGSAEGTAVIQLNEVLEMSATAKFNGASLPHVLDRTGLPHSWVELGLTGFASGTGQLNPLELAVTLDTNIDRFRTLAGPYDDSTSPRVFALYHGRITGRGKITPNIISVDNFNITTGRSSLRVSGILSTDTNVGMELRFADSPMNLRDFGKVAQVNFAGRGKIAGTIEGPYNDLVISSTATFSNFAVNGYRLGNIRSTVIFSDMVLNASRIVSQMGPGRLSGNGKVDFSKAKTHASGKFDIDDASLAKVVETLRLDIPLLDRLAGKIDARVVVDGPLVAPTVTADVSSTKVLVNGLDYGPGQVDVEVDGEKSMVWTKGGVRPADGRIDFRIGVGSKKDTIQANAKDVELDLLRPFLGNIDVSGKLAARINLQGNMPQLSGPVDIRAEDFAISDLKLQTLNLNAKADKGELTIGGAVTNQRAAVEGTIQLTNRMAHAVTVTFKELAFGKVWNLPANIKPQVSGSIFSQGDLMRPKSVIADAVLDEVSVALPNSVFVQTRPLRLTYANRTIGFSDVALQSPHSSLRISGKLPLDKAMRLNFQLGGDIAALQNLWPPLAAASGPFDINLRVGGTLDAPQLDGRGSIKDASIHVSKFLNPIRGLNAKLNFTGQTLQISTEQTPVGDGFVSLNGTIQLGTDKPSEGDFKVAFRNVPLQPAEALTADVSGMLAFKGPVKNGTLSGDVDIESLNYTANLNIEDLLRPKNTQLEVAVDPATQAWKLDVRIAADDKILISNNLVEAELQTSLRLTGTTARMGAIGTVDPLWARATYGGNSYEIERANIDFVGEYQIQPQFDIRATTEACGMNLVVSVVGTNKDYNIEATGTDEAGPVDPQDALLCAQFGVRMSTSVRTSDGTADLRDSLPGAVDAIWKVTGMDDRIREILPVVDEFRLTSGYSKASRQTEPRILVTKELGDKWELKYNGPVNTADDFQHVLALEYRLTPNITLESTWVSVSEVAIGDLGLDLKLHWEFE